MKHLDVVNAGPYAPVEYEELVHAHGLDAIRASWVACVVDTMSEGLIRNPADMARTLIPIAALLSNTTFTAPVAGVFPRQLTAKETAVADPSSPLAPTNPANITIRRGAPPVAKRRGRNTPDPIRDAMLKLKPGEFFTLDPTAFKKTTIYQKAMTLKKDGVLDKRVAVYEAVDRNIVVHFQEGEATGG